MIKPEDIKIHERRNEDAQTVETTATLEVVATHSICELTLRRYAGQREDILRQARKDVVARLWSSLYGDIHRPIKELYQIAIYGPSAPGYDRADELLKDIFAKIGFPAEAGNPTPVRVTEVDKLRHYLEKAGWGPCNIPACNCGGWHQVRMTHLEQSLMKERDEARNEVGSLCEKIKKLEDQIDNLNEELREERMLERNSD